MSKSHNRDFAHVSGDTAQGMADLKGKVCMTKLFFRSFGFRFITRNRLLKIKQLREELISVSLIMPILPIIRGPRRND